MSAETSIISQQLPVHI